MHCRFPGDEIPIIRGSALAALKGENPELGKDAIMKLMEAVDNYIPLPTRALDKPFSMPVEDVFSIQASILCWAPTSASTLHNPSLYVLLPGGVFDISVTHRHFDIVVQGRGTVITGRIEQGIVRTGDEIELVGIQNKPTKSVVTGGPAQQGPNVWQAACLSLLRASR